MKAKLHCKGVNDDTIFSHWRLLEVYELVSKRSEAALNVRAPHISSDNLSVFSNQAALRGLHEYF